MSQSFCFDKNIRTLSDYLLNVPSVVSTVLLSADEEFNRNRITDN
jgi:hypothetical protein